MNPDDTEAHVTPIEARQAVKTGRVRYILAISLTGVIVAFAILYAIFA
ncbi:MAG: hypothetical protein AB7N54_01915 [Alphaproteobacteria bacterium]